MKKLLIAFLFLFVISAVYLVSVISNSVANVQKLNEKGDLYYAEYIKDYYNPIASFPLNLIKSPGCLGAMTHLPNGNVVTGRNYDLAHKDNDNNLTGLNVVLKLTPEGKYQSINCADACWLTEAKLPYYSGYLNGSKLRNLPLAFLPYLCMDGINEKGLFASILAVDIKEGEHAPSQKEKDKERISVTVLLRYILDNCKDISEAIELTEQYNVCGILEFGYHLFLTDATGRAAVFEWRYDEFTVTETKVVTNFFVNSDDAQDCWINGLLKEEYVPSEPRLINYRYGYGHGYERFKLMTKVLDSCLVNGTKDKTIMSEQQLLDALASTRQEYDNTINGSYSQYSAIYNNSRRSLTIYPRGDNFEKCYSFSL